MKLYTITVPWSGYSRGYSTYQVQAPSLDHAKDECWESNLIDREVIRDDTEKCWEEAEHEEEELQ